MTSPTDIYQIQFRRGTAAEWAAANPVLTEGTPGFATDTNVVKIGDGVTAWNNLKTFEGPVGPASTVPGPPGISAGGAMTGDNLATLANTAPDKPVILDTDVFPIADSADAFKLKKFSWANLKKVISTATMTLTNKTLTAPKIDSILDADGNKSLRLSTVANSENTTRFVAGFGASGPKILVESSGTHPNVYLGLVGLGSNGVSLASTNGPSLNAVCPSPGSVNGLRVEGALAGHAPKVGVSGADTFIDLNLVSKGGGSQVLANNDPIVTTTAAQTLTNKTLTSPKVDGKIVSAGADPTIQLIAQPGGTVGTYYTGTLIYEAMSTTSPGSLALFRDPLKPTVFNITTNSQNQADKSPVDLNILPWGTGQVTVRNDPVVTTTAAQTLTNKTLASPKIDNIFNSAGNSWIANSAGTGQVLINGNPAVANVAVPASKTAPGKAGQMASAAGFVYVCVADNTWQRAALADW